MNARFFCLVVFRGTGRSGIIRAPASFSLYRINYIVLLARSAPRPFNDAIVIEHVASADRRDGKRTRRGKIPLVFRGTLSPLPAHRPTGFIPFR